MDKSAAKVQTGAHTVFPQANLEKLSFSTAEELQEVLKNELNQRDLISLTSVYNISFGPSRAGWKTLTYYCKKCEARLSFAR